jgi:hypothetical protein
MSRPEENKVPRDRVIQEDETGRRPAEKERNLR